MSQLFIRCADCGVPHDALHAFCPTTGRTTPWIHGADAIRNPRRPGPPRPPPLRDLVGKTIADKYFVRRVLGGGGMGTVFEAEHATIGRLVAVKVLHPVHARSKEAALRFRREARAAGRISHPNVCEVHDLGTLGDGRPYLVMEKLVGETLARRMATAGRLPLSEVVDVLVQVLSALIAAHQKGIIHRDVKPENIFLATRAGCPPLAKLLDFGAAKTVRSPVLRDDDDDDVDLTRRGMVMGTPHYLSSEQARGDRDLDARVDIYACGVILYEALTGTRPFAATDHGTLLRDILGATPRPVRELRRAIPAVFEAVVAKAMARNREDRYGSAAEFQRALQLLRDGPWPAPPPIPAPPSPLRCISDHGRSKPQWRGTFAKAPANDPESTRIFIRSPARHAADDFDTVVRPPPLGP